MALCLSCHSRCLGGFNGHSYAKASHLELPTPDKYELLPPHKHEDLEHGPRTGHPDLSFVPQPVGLINLVGEYDHKRTLLYHTKTQEVNDILFRVSHTLTASFTTLSRGRLSCS